MFPSHAAQHGTRVIDTKNILRLVDEHVVPGKKVFAQQPANRKSILLHALHVVEQHILVAGRVAADLEPIKSRVHGGSVQAGPGDSGVSGGFQIQIRRQLEIDNRHLGPRIEKEVVRARIVDGNSHYHLMLIDFMERDRFHVGGTARLGAEDSGKKCGQKKKSKMPHDVQ